VPQPDVSLHFTNKQANQPISHQAGVECAGLETDHHFDLLFVHHKLPIRIVTNCVKRLLYPEHFVHR
jgi:hypothetical protein